MTDRHNYAPEIKQALVDPTQVLEALGMLGEGRERRRQSRGWIILCPAHNERSPSCSVHVADGVLLWKCHGCEANGDVLDLVAISRNLDIQRDFKNVLIEAARIAGLWQVVDELEWRREVKPRPPPPPREPDPERTYPEGIENFWQSLEPVTSRFDVQAHLESRAIDPNLVEARDLARALPDVGALPPWAMCRGGTWREAGFRLIVPMFDALGVLRTVRGWRVIENNLPKRLPPSGCKASAVVMADEWGRAMLAATLAPERIVIAEGEPDALTWMTRLNEPRTAVLGIVSGSWCKEIAASFPVGARVDVWTDHDEAGDRYANEIVLGLRRRCFVYRQVAA